MKKLKAIVVEDEQLPRLTLLQKLDDYSLSVEVVDACDSYESARDSILLYRPDLVLLDIQLNGRNSIELLEELQHTIKLPYVIFTTAYSDRKYLLSAIKLSAVDYLIKPIDKAELAHAIAKAAERAAATARSAAPAAMPPETEKIAFRSVNGKLFIPTREIAYIKADGNYAIVVTFSGQDMILENLLSLENRLPREHFLRIDRSTIVGTDRIYRLNTRESSCILRSDDGRQQELKLSKSGMATLSERLWTSF